MRNRPSTGKKIAVVGGGPGGLTLARLLQMRGADVTVYERDRSRDVRVQGATLDLHQDSGLAALRAAGLMDAFLANYRPGADLMRIVDSQTNIVYDQHEDACSKTVLGPYSRPEIDRGPLRDILLESLLPGTVVWDSHVTAAEPTEHGWKIHFRNGTSALADIVIGADGANSKIRPFVTPIRPFFSGITGIEGNVSNSATTVPHIHALLKGGKLCVVGDSKTLFISSKGDGSLAFYTGCRTDEFWGRDCGLDFGDGAQMLAWFRREFAGWSAVWHALFDNGKTTFVPRPMYCMPLDQTWEAQSDITLLGDAAHLMPPYAGEGVNMAMLDALELSRCLTTDDFPDTQAAIVSYETHMRRRASEAAKETLENTEWLHSPDALSHMVAMFGG